MRRVSYKISIFYSFNVTFYKFLILDLVHQFPAKCLENKSDLAHLQTPLPARVHSLSCQKQDFPSVFESSVWQIAHSVNYVPVSCCFL